MLMRTFAERTQDFATHNRKAPDHALSYPSRVMVHPKLAVSQPNDHEEVEAEKAASDVMSFGKIQRKVNSESGDSGLALPSRTASNLGSSLGSGFSMPSRMAQSMEASFGADFSAVRFHTDESAIRMNQDINAEAFTYGNDIYFNRGKYSPNTDDGKRLIAHELTHTLQGGGKIKRKSTQENEGQELEQEFLNSSIGKIDTTKKEKLKNKSEKYRFLISYIDSIIFPDSSSIYVFLKGKHISLLYDAFEKTENNNTSDLKLFHFFVKRSVSIIFNNIQELHRFGDTYQREDLATSKGSELLDQVVTNYLTLPQKRLNSRRGITIALITHSTGDSKRVFKGIDYREKASETPKDNSLYKSKDLFVLQGLASIDAYLSEIQRIISIYGPLQNLIISGHGSYKSIDMGPFKFVKDDQNTKEFFKRIGAFMADKRMKHSIYLDACSTASPIYENQQTTIFNFRDMVQESAGSHVKIIANVAKADRQNVTVASSGVLEVKDANDPNIFYSKNANSTDFFGYRPVELGKEYWENRDKGKKRFLQKLATYIAQIDSEIDKNENFLRSRAINMDKFIDYQSIDKWYTVEYSSYIKNHQYEDMKDQICNMNSRLKKYRRYISLLSELIAGYDAACSPLEKDSHYSYSLGIVKPEDPQNPEYIETIEINTDDPSRKKIQQLIRDAFYRADELDLDEKEEDQVIGLLDKIFVGYTDLKEKD